GSPARARRAAEAPRQRGALLLRAELRRPRRQGPGVRGLVPAGWREALPGPRRPDRHRHLRRRDASVPDAHDGLLLPRRRGTERIYDRTRSRHRGTWLRVRRLRRAARSQDLPHPPGLPRAGAFDPGEAASDLASLRAPGRHGFHESPTTGGALILW